MKRTVIVLICCMLLFSVLTACNIKAETENPDQEAIETATSKDLEEEATAVVEEETEQAGPITITHFTWQLADAGEAFNLIVEKYKESHPNIVIDVQNIASDQYYSTLQTRLLGGDPPDIITTGPGEAQYGSQAKNGYLLDITDEQMIENVQTGVLSNVTINERIYGVPNGLVSLVVLYNKAVFEANNIEIPTNYEELLGVCETLKSNGITPFAYGIKDSYVSQFLLYQIAPTAVYSKNPNWDKDLVEGKVHFNSAEWVRVLGIPFELKESGYFTEDALGVGDQQSVEMFARGDAAMTINGTWATGTARAANPDIEIGAFPFPANEADEEAWMALSISSILTISSSSPVIDECKEYLTAWTSPEYAQIFTDNAKVISTMKDVDNNFDPTMDDLKPYLETLNSWQFANAGWPKEEITTELLKKFQEVYAGQGSIEDILNAMDNAIE